jgi:hypothetical protein
MYPKIIIKIICFFYLPPAALPGAKLLKKFDQNFCLINKHV